MQTAFAKYEGAGNDFILIDNREGGFTPRAELIAALCDRHFGIGADGLMTLARNAEIDCSMRYYNADGSEGEMCGNGARCFALFAEHRGIRGIFKYENTWNNDPKAEEHNNQMLDTIRSIKNGEPAQFETDKEVITF